MDAFSSVSTVPPRPSLVTWLPPDERAIVIAHQDEGIDLSHVSSLASLRVAMLSGDVSGVLVSAALLSRQRVAALAAAHRGCPDVVVAALVTAAVTPVSLVHVEHLAAHRATPVADLRTRDGWHTLHALLSSRAYPSPLSHLALRAFHGAVGRLSPAAITFVQALVAAHPMTTGDIASRLGIPYATLSARFRRLGLPELVVYLQWARLAVAVHLAHSTPNGATSVAERVGYASKQSLSRCARRLTGCSFAALCHDRTSGSIVAEIGRTLFEPYREALRTIDLTPQTGMRSRMASVARRAPEAESHERETVLRRSLACA